MWRGRFGEPASNTEGGAHCSTTSSDLELDTELWKKHWKADTWKEYLCEPRAEADVKEIRRCTHTGRLGAGGAPFLSFSFVTFAYDTSLWACHQRHNGHLEFATYPRDLKVRPI